MLISMRSGVAMAFPDWDIPRLIKELQLNATRQKMMAEELNRRLESLAKDIRLSEEPSHHCDCEEPFPDGIGFRCTNCFKPIKYEPGQGMALGK